jgi:putative protease
MLPLTGRSEYIVHGLFPVMVSEHCVMGNLKPDGCGGHCPAGPMVIKDQKGYEFPVASDTSCRMYVFNSRTTCLLSDIPALQELGVDDLRIEALLDAPERVGEEVSLYRQALDQVATDPQPDLSVLKNGLERIAHSPLTKLHFYRGVE